MASILFDSPIPYESISSGGRKEQALGGELAANAMNSYFRAQALRADEQRWAEELPLRNARYTLLSAQAANEKAESELNALAAANRARRQQSMADLAGVQEEAAMRGWDTESEGKFYNFMSRHPEFVGSQEALAVEKNFGAAKTLRDREEQWRTREATRLTIERMRQEAEDAGEAVPTTWVDPETGLRYAVSQPGGQMSPLRPRPTNVARRMVDESGNVIPGSYVADDGRFTVPRGPYGDLEDDNPPPSGPQRSGPAGPGVQAPLPGDIQYDINGNRIR